MEYKAEEYLHIASTGHRASSSVSAASLQYALTRLSKLTAKSHHFTAGRKQHHGHVVFKGKARAGMTVVSSGAARKA